MLAATAYHPGAGDTASAYATLESFLLHARNLHAFLTTAGPWKDTDVLASDFVDGYVELDGPLAKDELTRIHQQLAHITTERDKKVKWTRPGIAKRVLGAFGRFLGELEHADERRYKVFEPTFRNARDVIRKRP